MTARKLQAEVDKTLKKVTEGVAAFESIYEKMQSASNQSQKDKLEGDLKKEIKKLQRMRDHIKTWASSNDIKDKKPLQENRKLIEMQMERFKACEKEIKTKAFSKEGLLAGLKLDSKEKERLETSHWLSSMVDELERQIEQLEIESEILQGSLKKKNKDYIKSERLDRVEHLLERHKWHQDKLELILRLLENGNLQTEQVLSIQEDIKYYVESNQDTDFTEDENIYDDLNLSEIFGRTLDNEIDSSLETQSLADETSPCTQKDKDERTKSTESLSTVSSYKAKSRSPILVNASTPQNTNGTTKALQSKTQIDALKQLSTIYSLNTNTVFPSSSSDAKESTVASSASQEASPVTSFSNPQHELIKSSDIQETTDEYQEKNILEPLENTDSSLEALPHEIPIDISPVEKSSIESQTHTSSLTDLSKFPHYLKDLVSSLKTIKQKTLNPPPISIIHRLLEISFTTAPEPVNSESPKYYTPSEPYPVPPYYPQVPPAIFDSPELFEKIDIDALFFVFYYQQGTYQQYLAAKELKKQAWRFHKKYLTWFQRHEEPKIITDEYESGTYRYFDFEGAWVQRKKPDFKFQYVYLEDED
ncbi:hypothetical protein T552_03124 [Pneumocystis carinii B80]|uniref:General negative regulator of transcription subunit n=1 Tax=Pneumocystis carinii (strain B80) TaxID=1408658 RepID=A0A0W4ZBR7_PNEC8|nr:hypothetical protein T552_03124 [Pneumocystis carinii B80]KTW25851.1 hypothetical protein T552_03124 [Pneumocystis carinii B80]